MKREILISAANRETRVAILEDDQLVELLVDRPDVKRLNGDIFIGRVDAVLPGIQAAFVDIGTEKSAFLHASDLVYDEAVDDDDDEEDEDEDEDEQPDEDDKNGASHARGDRRRAKRRAEAPAIQDVLKKGQDIIVQVTKEAISTKGPRVTAQVSLAGVSGLRYSIESSSEFTDWRALTNVVATNGIGTFTDLSATNSSQRFYRAASQP